MPLIEEEAEDVERMLEETGSEIDRLLSLVNKRTLSGLVLVAVFSLLAVVTRFYIKIF